MFTTPTTNSAAPDKHRTLCLEARVCPDLCGTVTQSLPYQFPKAATL